MSTVKRYTGNLSFEGLTTNSVVSFNSNSSILINGDLEVLGNTTLSGNISGDSLNSGTTSIGIPTPSGNANITVGGVSNVLVVATTGAAVTGNLAVSGTLTAGTFVPTTISASGNVSGSNINAAGNVFVTQNASANTPTVRLIDSNTAATTNTVIGSYEWFVNDSSAPGARTVAAIRANTVDTAGNVRVDILTGNTASLVQSVSVLPNGNVGIANTTPGHLFSVNGAGYFGTTITAVGNVVGGNITTAGQVSATANITGGNIRAAGQLSATGNIIGGNSAVTGAATATTFSATGNVTGGNLVTAGQVTAGGNVTGANLVTAGVVSASGNITGGSLQVSGTANAASLTGGSLSVTGSITGGTTVSAVGNVTGGNISTAGRVSATGNVLSSGFFIGDGSQLTNVTAASNVVVQTIANGTSSMQVLGPGGNIMANIAGTTNVALFTSTGLISTTLTAVGNATAGNLVTAGQVSATGNITGGNVGGTTGTFVTVIGNANATALTSGTVPSARLTGSYNINIDGTAATANTVTLAAQPNITSVGTLTSLDVTANVQAGNLRTSGLVSATGNVIAGNITTAGVVSTAGNVQAGNVNSGLISSSGNVLVAGFVSASGNVTGAIFNGSGAGLTSVPAATTAGTVTTAAQPNITSVGTLTALSVGTGNITGGNLLLSGAILDSAQLDIQTTAANANIVLTPNGTGNVNIGRMSASGNITAATYFGSGAGLTSVAAATAGTVTTAAQPNITSVGTLTGLTVTNTITGNITGSAATAGTVTTNAQPNITSVGTLSSLAVTGNTTSGNLITVGNVNTTGRLVATGIEFTNYSWTTVATAGGTTLILGGVNQQKRVWVFTGTQNQTLTMPLTTYNTVVPEFYIINKSTGQLFVQDTVGFDIITIPSGADCVLTGVSTSTSAAANWHASLGALNNLTGATVSASGNITGGNLITAGLVSLSSITKTGSNGVGNIGASDSTFNTIFAKATSAQYADLAEMYVSDAVYAPGTVVIFGGSQEVTVSDQSNDTKVAGVVSTNPAYIMNSGLDSEFVVAVALQGRVPTRVAGTVRKGDIMVSSANGHAEANNSAKAGTILGKALENFDGITGVIEVVVGRV
jgi:hypothetical protein